MAKKEKLIPPINTTFENLAKVLVSGNPKPKPKKKSATPKPAK